MDILSRIENKASDISKSTALESMAAYSHTQERTLLKKIISEKQEELDLLKKLEGIFSDDAFSKETAETEINSYLTMNEQNYLHAKVLAVFTGPFTYDVQDPARAEELYGKMICGPYKLEKVGAAYKFTLPHLISKYTAFKNISDGQAISKLVSYLIRCYEREHKETVPMMEKATIAFVHYVSKNKIPDPDNLDVKAVIDALKGKMIEEDDVLRVSLYHEGVLSNEPFTEVYLVERKQQERGTFPVAIFGLF